MWSAVELLMDSLKTNRQTGVSEAQVAREDITQKSTKTIPLRLERAVTQYGDFQFA